jgi:ATP-dependent helicase HrpA
MRLLNEITVFWRPYLDYLQAQHPQAQENPELESYRWMLEEFRVSLFAQELKTAYPVSAKRLQQQWKKV